MSRGPECTWINKFNFGLSVVFCRWHHWQVFLSHKKTWLIQSRTAHLSPLSTFIPNYNIPGELLMQASLEETVNINTNIIPLNFNTSLLHSIQTTLIYLICFAQSSSPIFMHTFVWDCLWTCFMESISPFHFLPLSHFPSVSLFPRERCHEFNCRQVTRS